MSTFTQRAFSSGELDPALHARVDYNKYYTGLKKLKNFIVKKQGGVENRAGTQFLEIARASATNVRLIPFDAGPDYRFIIELSHLKMRFIQNDSYIYNVTARSITAASNANPCVFTYSGADSFTAGDYIYAYGFDGDLGQYLNGRYFKIGTVDTGANTFQVLNLDGTNFNSTSLPAYTSGGFVNKIYELTSPFDEADLFELQYAQSGLDMVFANENYEPRYLSNNGTPTGWSISTDPSSTSGGFSGVGILLASPTITQVGAAGATTYSYEIRPVGFNGEIGLERVTGYSTKTTTTGNATLSSANANKITIGTTVGDIAYYNIYRQEANGDQYGLIGITNTKVFVDIGYEPDFTQSPPEVYYSDEWDSDYYGTDYPACVNFVGQRLCFANFVSDNEAVIGSAVARYRDFTEGLTTSDAPVKFRVNSRKVNPIRHILDLNSLVIMTENGEFVVNPDGSPLTKDNISVKGKTYNGCSRVSPLVINDNALYVDNDEQTVRDLFFSLEADGISGNDLSIFSRHLFEGHAVIDWCYQKNPDSIVWIVRSDGALLSLTYLREQRVLAWSQHDLYNGLAESICSIKDYATNEDAVYIVVKRTINGSSVKYIEKLTSRLVLENKTREVSIDGVMSFVEYDSTRDLKMSDSTLSYDGRFGTGVTVTISENTGWTTDDYVDVVIAGSTFATTDVGNQIHVYLEDGTPCKINLVTYTNATTFVGQPINMTVPEEIRDIPTSNAGKAVDTLSGLWHLEGESVSVLADGYVKHSARNSDYEVKTVSDGQIVLDDCYVVIHVGLPVRAELQTLNIDTVNGETLIDKKINIQKVTLNLNKTRGLKAGKDEDSDLQELRPRNQEGYNQAARLMSEPADVIIEANWESSGSVYVRQDDPLPANILSVSVSGYIPTR